MDAQARLTKLDAVKSFFEKSTACLLDGDGGFAPKEGMFTVAEHVAHTAQTVAWFVEGAFLPDGFSRDYAALEARIRGMSLGDARDWMNRVFVQAAEVATQRSDDEWNQPIADPEIMSGSPRWMILEGISDHSAHHRGALVVYARLCGREPAMPYD